MGFMVLDPNNDRGHKIDVIPEKGQEYQAAPIFGKDNINRQVEIPRRKSALILNLGVQNSATIHGYHTVTDFSDTHCCMN
jgi:hypothetical protein